MSAIGDNLTGQSQVWTHQDKTAHGKGTVGLIACGVFIIAAGFITMFVIGILGTQGVIPMSPGGAYALTVLGVLPLTIFAVAGIKAGCGN